MEALVIVHLLAACVWVGGSIVLIAAGVPAIRILEGEPRVRAMREIGRRWRRVGYPALALLAVTGIPLAMHDYDEGRSPFQTVLWVKIGLSAGLVAFSYLHNFVLGPRVQAEVREGRAQTSLRQLVVVGWISFGFTLAVPILGAVLSHLAP